MDKNKLMKIAIGVLVAILVVYLIIIIIMAASSAGQRTIRVEIEAGESHSLEFKRLGLVPGEECGYTVKLSSDDTSKFDLTLGFLPDQSTGLENYARVKLVTEDGEILCDELLADAFDIDPLVLSVDLDEGLNDRIEVIYYMPDSVGNEAEETEATFQLVITASNE